MSAADIVLEWIFPLLGGIVGLLMFMAPLKAVLKARSERVLGELNPVPFPAQAANTAGWIAYTYILAMPNGANPVASKDLQAAALIYWPNQLGLLAGLFFTFSCYGLAPTKTRDRQLAIMLFFTMIIPLVGAIGVMSGMSRDSLQQLWGFTANAILLVYYAAPLSTIITVLSSRSAASLNWPLAIMQLVNGSLWMGYGLAIGDFFVWVPNAVGACTGGLCIALLILFREKKTQQKAARCAGNGAGPQGRLNGVENGVEVGNGMNGLHGHDDVVVNGGGGVADVEAPVKGGAVVVVANGSVA